MHTVLDRTLTEAGTLLALQSAVSLLGQFMSGFLADRFGPKRIMMIAFMGASLVMFFIYGKIVQRFHLLQQTPQAAMIER